MNMRYLLRSALTFLAVTGLVRADPIQSIYVGPPGTFEEEPTNYTVSDNWSPIGVPNNVAGSAYFVTIPRAVFVDTPIVISDLTITTAGSLTVKNTPAAAGRFDVAGDATVDGSLVAYSSNVTLHGALTNFDSATSTLNSGSLVVEGLEGTANLQFTAAAIAHNGGNLTLVNTASITDQLGRNGLRNFADNLASGTFEVGPGYLFVAPNNFMNAGTIEVRGPGFDPHGGEIPAGNFEVAAGHEYIQTGGSTVVEGTMMADLLDFQGGQLSLNFVVAGTVMLESATLAPTDSFFPRITGDLNLSSDSTLLFSIPSSDSIVDGQFTLNQPDHLTVGGDVTLGKSTLAVQVAAGFPVSSHATFTILDSTGTVGGRLGNVTSGSRLTTLDGLGSFVVSLSNQTLLLSSFQTVPAAAQFANLSTRGNVLTGDNVLIGGLIVVGTQAKNVILRALGPSLSSKGISNPLADPVLELHDSTGGLIASNNNWKDTQQFAIESTGIPPTDDLESALVTSLQPGLYTIVVRGNNDVTGTALVEAYDLSPKADTTLSNLSTRGFVDAANPLIGGFIAGFGTGTNETVARAIGPNLIQRGLASPLNDPMLEVRDVDGNLVGSNDDYVPGSDSIIGIDGLEPADPREAAIRLSLAPGAYTVLVLAKTGDSGTALVELYDLYH